MEGFGVFTTSGNPLVLIKLRLCKSRWLFGLNATLLASDVTTDGVWLACSGVDIVGGPQHSISKYLVCFDLLQPGIIFDLAA